MIKRVLMLCVLLLAVLTVSAQDYKTPQELADPDGRFLDVEGTSIYIRTRGEADDPAVILLHGFGGSTFTWRHALDPIAEAGFYVVALDLPPFGLSDKSADLDYSRSALADLVVDVMDELEIENAVVVGHSMGGGVTASLGARHPERVNGLIFVSGGVFEALADLEPSDDAQTSGGGLSDLSGFMETLDPASPFAALLVRTFLTPERFTDLLTSAYVRKEVITPDVIAGYQRPLQTEDWPQGLLAFSTAEEMKPITLNDLAAAVQDYDIPVLIVWGASDPWVTPALAQAMHDALPDSQLITYEGVGHLPMEEDTDVFNADVTAFLQTIAK